MLARLLLFCRDIARCLGLWLRGVARRLVTFGEYRECMWGVAAFLRIQFTEIEITDFYPRSHCGPVYGARFQYCGRGGKNSVVLSLNWIATEDQSFSGSAAPVMRRVFGGMCELVIDPVSSPLHELSDGTLWFMWPEGGYAVFHPMESACSRFAGDPNTPRVYKYF